MRQAGDVVRELSVADASLLREDPMQRVFLLRVDGAFQLRQRARDRTRAFTLLTCFCAVCAGEAAPAPATTAAAAVQALGSDAPADAQLAPAAAATQGEDGDSAEKTASTTDQPEAKDTGTLLSARKRFRGRRRLAVNSQSAL